MLTTRVYLFLGGTLALLPLLIIAALLWRRYYREDAANATQRVVKNSAVPTAARLIVRAIDMGFALVLYRLLSATMIGQYDLAALLVVQYLGTFADFGLGTLLVREVARRPDAAPHYFGSTLVLRWALSLLMIPAALLVIGVYGGLADVFPSSQALSHDGTLAILILCLTLFPSAYNNVVTALFNARERLEVPAFVELVTQIVSVIARVGVLWAGWGVVGLAWAAVGTTTLTACILLFLQVRLLFPPRLSWDWSFARGLLRPAFPLLLNGILVNVAFSFDVFILRAFTNDNVVAQYRMPYRVINVALILTPLLTNAIFPMMARAAEGNRAQFNRAYRLTLQVLLLVAFPVVIATGILATDLVTFFAGSRDAWQYVGFSDRALVILICFLPPSYINGLTQYVLIALDQQRSITRAFAIMAAFNFFANLLLIPFGGIYAASALTVAAEVVLYLRFLPLLRREGVAQALGALAWQPLLAALTMGMAMLALYPLGGWLASALIAAPVYVLALYLLDAFGEEERALARRVLGRS